MRYTLHGEKSVGKNVTIFPFNTPYYFPFINGFFLHLLNYLLLSQLLGNKPQKNKIKS